MWVIQLYIPVPHRRGSKMFQKKWYDYKTYKSEAIAFEHMEQLPIESPFKRMIFRDSNNVDYVPSNNSLPF